MSRPDRKKLKDLVQEGLRFLDERKWPEAVERFEKARDTDPEHPVPYLFGSLAYWAGGRAAQSKQFLEEALARRPRNTLARNIMALHAFGRKNTAKALAILKEHGLAENPRIQSLLLFEIEKALMEGRR